MAKSQITGAKKVVANMKRIAMDAKRGFGGALYAEGLHIMADSVPRTPVVTSRLRNSQFVTVPEDIARPTVRFGYGTKYAFRVHEGIVTRLKDLPRHAQRAAWGAMNAQVSTSSRSGGSTITWKRAESGGPKYLEAAVDATASGRQQRIQRTTDRYTERRIGVLASPNMPDSEEAGAAKGAQNARSTKNKARG